MAEKIIVQYELDTKQFKAQIDQINKRLNEIENSGKKSANETKKGFNEAGNSIDNFNHKLKTTGSSFGSLSDLTKKAGAAFAGLFAAEKVVSIFQNAVETIKEFDQSIQDLSAITGASGADLEKYKQAAIQMGAGVQGGAAATVEAFKLIGSAKPELLSNADALIGVTEAAITLSKAAGMDLPSAATALTDALNQFGAPAEEAGRYINVLAAGSKFGAVEIPQVTEALLKFGAAAKTSNVSIEESTALIEALGEKGLKGAEAGTAIRNVLLKIGAPDALPKDAQQALEGLGISFESLTDTSKPLSERFEALKPLLNDNAALVKVFGTENVIAATNILQNTDRLRELTSQVSGTNTAYEQAEIRSKTLNEALNRLRETYNGIILGFANSGDASGKFAGAIDVVSENMDNLIDMFMRINKPIFDIYEAIGNLIAAFDSGEESSVKVADGLNLLEIAFRYLTLPVQIFQKIVKEVVDVLTIGVTWFQETAKESTALGNTLRVVGETARTVFEAMKDLFGINAKPLNMAEKAALDYAYAQEKVNIALAKGKAGQAEMDEIYKRVSSQIDITREMFDKYVKKKQEEKKATEEVNEINETKTLSAYERISQEISDINKRMAEQILLTGKASQEDVNRLTFLTGKLGVVQENLKRINDLSKPIEIKFDTVGVQNLNEEVINSTMLLEELAKDSGAYLNETVKLIGDTTKKTFEENVASAQEAIGVIAQGVDEIANVVAQVQQRQRDEIDRTYDAQVLAIENSTLSEEQKDKKIAALRKKQALEQYELQKKQFEVNKAIAIVQAIINTAAGIVAQFQAGPAGIALAAIAAAAGIAQIAIIASQQPPPPPAFAKGTDFVQRGNNKPGIDTIPAYLNEGEAVIPTEQNKKYPGLSKAWINGNLDDYIVRQFVAPRIAEIERKAEDKWMEKFTANISGEKFDDMNLLRATTEGNMYLRTIAREIKQRPQKRTVN